MVTIVYSHYCIYFVIKTPHTLVWDVLLTKYIQLFSHNPNSTINEVTFLRDFLVVLKRPLQELEYSFHGRDCYSS